MFLAASLSFNTSIIESTSSLRFDIIFSHFRPTFALRRILDALLSPQPPSEIKKVEYFLSILFFQTFCHKLIKGANLVLCQNVLQFNLFYVFPFFQVYTTSFSFQINFCSSPDSGCPLASAAL